MIQRGRYNYESEHWHTVSSSNTKKPFFLNKWKRNFVMFRCERSDRSFVNRRSTKTNACRWNSSSSMDIDCWSIETYSTYGRIKSNFACKIWLKNSRICQWKYANELKENRFDCFSFRLCQIVFLFSWPTLYSIENNNRTFTSEYMCICACTFFFNELSNKRKYFLSFSFSLSFFYYYFLFTNYVYK